MLTDVLLQISLPLQFTLLNIGARPVSQNKEPFEKLIGQFPGSHLHCFELDEPLCQQLNQTNSPGITYHCHALGLKNETRTLYQTQHPMCTSLYKPNEKLIDQYHSLEFAKLSKTSDVQTISLDQFVQDNQIGQVDLIKIDIQGAELDVFQGGQSTLQQTACIISEVEFVPIYEKQPLFGDVCQHLTQMDFDFHKFLCVGGRSRKPAVIQNDPFFITQQMWADALFLRCAHRLEQLCSDQLLKLAIFCELYNSPDVTIACLLVYDQKEQTQITQLYLNSKKQPLPTAA